MGRGLDGFLIFVLLALCGFEGPRRVSSKHRTCFVRELTRNDSLFSREESRKISGGYSVGETPFPISNRDVKPHSADGTWPARAWESRSPPVLIVKPPHMGWLY